METAARRRRSTRGVQRRRRQKEISSGHPARPGSDWKPEPWTIHFLIGQDAFETGATSPARDRGGAPEGTPAVRKPRGQHLDTVRREAPGPWRIGGEDGAGVHVLDANGERIATIWKTPSRLDSALAAIQALMVRMVGEMLAPRPCANPECRHPFDAPSRTQEHCSASCAMATQRRVREVRKRDRHTYELRERGITWREIEERCGYSDRKRAQVCAQKHARRNGLTLPTRG